MVNTLKPDDNTSSPLKELYNNDSPSTYVYPGDLGNNGDPYLVFRRVKYNRRKRLDLAKKNLLSSVFLPIPANLQVQHGVNYSNVDLGVVGNFISNNANLRNVDMSSKEGLKTAASEVGSSITSSDVLNQLTPRALKNIAEGIGNITGTNFATGAQLANGTAINSHLAVLFEDVGFRSHEFSYKFIARNRQESAEIRNIIQVFKYAMYPSLGGEYDSFFEYPDEWFIHFRKGYRENLYDFAACVLTNFSVSYNGSNVPVFFEDTLAPVDIDITLSFQETEIITKEKIEKEYSKRGGFGEIRGSTLSRGQDTSDPNDEGRSLEERRNSPMGLI